LPGIGFAELAAHQHDALLARAWDMLHDEGIDVRGYLQQAEQHASEGAYAQAIAAYTQVLTIQPECADAYVGRGQVYFKQKNYKQAIAEYRQALQLAPDNAAAYYYRGEAHDRLGNEHNAKQDFARARRRGFRRP
jgi:tetratricopeptide (TPR) repeat protein